MPARGRERYDVMFEVYFTERGYSHTVRLAFPSRRYTIQGKRHTASGQGRI